MKYLLPFLIIFCTGCLPPGLTEEQSDTEISNEGDAEIAGEKYDISFYQNAVLGNTTNSPDMYGTWIKVGRIETTREGYSSTRFDRSVFHVDKHEEGGAITPLFAVDYVSGCENTFGFSKSGNIFSILGLAGDKEVEMIDFDHFYYTSDWTDFSQTRTVYRVDYIKASDEQLSMGEFNFLTRDQSGNVLSDVDSQLECLKEEFVVQRDEEGLYYGWTKSSVYSNASWSLDINSQGYAGLRDRTSNPESYSQAGGDMTIDSTSLVVTGLIDILEEDGSSANINFNMQLNL